VDFASAAEVDEAVAVAVEAFAAWRASALSRRAECMFRLRDLVDQNRRRIAELATLEHGKTVADALGEVGRGLENLEFACGIPNLLKGGYSEQASRGVDVYQIRQPLGVVAGITPFNFPAMVPLWMFPNAIACGNAFILKPSEKDPSVSLLLADLVRQAFALKPYQLAAPNWLGTERFDITAVIPHGATRPQFREMLQNLLAERFRMTYHRASKIVPQYALAISPKGHKLRAAGAAPDRSQSPPESEGYPSFEGPGMIVRNGRARLQLDQETLAQLAGRLANQIGQPVLDATGLTDKFSFSLYWVTDAEGPGESGPGIFQAVQEQLGLQLRPQKGPIEVLVVDTMEKTPSGN